MTNKEAIAELKAMPIIYPITNGENDRASRLMQARDMAIKALEQEPVCDRLAREYISKIKCCDECFLSTFCTINDLRESREPKYYCIENIKKYFESKSGARNDKRRRNKFIVTI